MGIFIPKQKSNEPCNESSCWRDDRAITCFQSFVKKKKKKRSVCNRCLGMYCLSCTYSSDTSNVVGLFHETVLCIWYSSAEEVSWLNTRPSRLCDFFSCFGIMTRTTYRPTNRMAYTYLTRIKTLTAPTWQKSLLVTLSCNFGHVYSCVCIVGSHYVEELLPRASLRSPWSKARVHTIVKYDNDREIDLGAVFALLGWHTRGIWQDPMGSVRLLAPLHLLAAVLLR